MDKQVLHELHVVGKFMLKLDPDATLAELLAKYFGYVTGEDYSELLGEPPDDVEVIELHLGGATPRQIADQVSDDADYIRWLLTKYGFVLNRKTSSASYRTSKVERERVMYEGLVNDGILT